MEALNSGRDDRLSDLPEPILHHILSFLDTRAAVQTSVLSRSWRCAWKQVPVLDLSSYPFKLYRIFQRYVDKVLSLRCNLKLHKMIYSDEGNKEELDSGLFVRVIEYAWRHDTQHLGIDLNNGIEYFDHYFRFTTLFGSNLVAGCSNLRTLELASVSLDSGFLSFGFRMLTKLKLDWCDLWFRREKELDPFSNFPCLQDLAVRNCGNGLPGHLHKRWFKFSGLQLRSLAIESIQFFKIEVSAPKLKSFQFREDAGLPLESVELGLPSLDHADILVSGWLDDYDGARAKQRWISLFQGLHNVKSLTLHSGIIQALSNVSEFLEKQPSPFTRSEHLNLLSNRIHHKWPITF